MSKMIDRLVAEAIFRKEPKETKVKKEISLKDYMKFEKEMEEFKEWKKSKEPKKDDKPKTAWEAMSVPKKLTILMITVPMALMAETAILVKFAVTISNLIH